MNGWRAHARRWLCVALVVALLAPTGVRPEQIEGLEVRPASEATLSTPPRKLLTLVFQVRNATPAAGRFEAQVDLPEGWRSISREQPFELGSGETTPRFVGVFIPEGASAGDYPVRYRLAPTGQPALSATASVTVRVQSLPRLKVIALEAPDAVVSGAAYRAVFLVTNAGNAALAVNTLTSSSRGHAIDAATTTLNLAVGESRRVEIGVVTAPVKQLENEWLRFTARARDASSVAVAGAAPGLTDAALSQEATSVVKLLPRVSGVEQRFHTIAATASMSHVTQADGTERRAGWIATLAAAGALDAAGEQRVALLLRGPNAQALSSYGLAAEYRFDYIDPRLSFSVGDQAYGFDGLTGYVRWGRGASLGYRFTESLAIGGFYSADRFSLDERKQSGLSASWQTDAASRVDLNLLQHSGRNSGAVASLRSRDQWAPGLRSDFEYARSSGAGQAVRGYLADERNSIRYTLAMSRASSAFVGLNPAQSASAGSFLYPVSDTLEMRGHFRTLRRDERLAATLPLPLLAPLPLGPVPVEPWQAVLPAQEERHAGIGAQWRAGARTRFGFDYLGRMIAERGPMPTFDTVHHGVRLSAQQLWQGLSLFASGQFGVTEDRARNERFATHMLLASGNWQATNRQSYGAYVYEDSNSHAHHKTVGRQRTAGLTAHYRPDASSSIGAGVHVSQAQQSRVTWDLRMAYRQANGNTAALALRHAPTGAGRTDAIFTYTIPFGLPVGLNRKVGRLRGRVHDAASGSGIANVVMRLGSLVAVSDSDGGFFFASVGPGTQRLSIEGGASASGKVPVRAMPVDIEIREGTEVNMDVALMSGATLQGRVVVEDAGERLLGGTDAAAPPPVDAVETRGLANALVVLRNGDLVYRRLTNEQGNFRLGGLLPGRWTATVEQEGLPAGFELADALPGAEVAPGGEARFDFKLTRKVRTLRVIKELPPVTQQ